MLRKFIKIFLSEKKREKKLTCIQICNRKCFALKSSINTDTKLLKKRHLRHESYKRCSLNDPALMILRNVVLWLPRYNVQQSESEVSEPKPENALEEQRDFVGKEQV